MINDVERCHSGDCHQGNTDDPSCELHHFLTQPTRSDPFSSRSANRQDTRAWPQLGQWNLTTCAINTCHRRMPKEEAAPDGWQGLGVVGETKPPGRRSHG